MNVRTYRAKTMQEALALVRCDLGLQASVLMTREVRAAGWFRWFSGPRLIEVVASTGVTVPSRLPPRQPPLEFQPLMRQPGAPAVSARHIS
jgi:flagellar biosynthesis protein FlhF